MRVDSLPNRKGSQDAGSRNQVFTSERLKAERKFLSEVISAESQNIPKETISAESANFGQKRFISYEHPWSLISAEMTLFRPKLALSAENHLSAKMTPKAERFRQVPKMSLLAERPKRGPFGRTLVFTFQLSTVFGRGKGPERVMRTGMYSNLSTGH